MRQLNGVYSPRINRRHGRVGHVFQCVHGRRAGHTVDLDHAGHMGLERRKLLAVTRRSSCRRNRTCWNWPAMLSSVRSGLVWCALQRNGYGAIVALRQAV